MKEKNNRGIDGTYTLKLVNEDTLKIVKEEKRRSAFLIESNKNRVGMLTFLSQTAIPPKIAVHIISAFSLCYFRYFRYIHFSSPIR